MYKSIINKIQKLEQYPLFLYLSKWLTLSAIIGALIGCASAFFLITLQWATDYRESNVWIISLLPIGGLIIGLMYYYFGENVVHGNNQILDELYEPKKRIPFKMAPLVFLGTIITHLFGGSAGREGTAVQMGAAISDQFTHILKLTNRDRQTILILGISAGFASVFGTPIAGAIFALEVMVIGKIKYEAILPSILVAVIANYVCNIFPVHHTHYLIALVPQIT